MTAYILAMTLTLIDYGQTNKILASNGHWYEGNPIIVRTGPDKYFGAVAVANTAIYALVPEKYSKWYFLGFNIVQIQTVGVNHYLGVRIDF